MRPRSATRLTAGSIGSSTRTAGRRLTPVSIPAMPGRASRRTQDDNQLWRMHAQRLLVERRKTDVVPELIKLVRDTSVDAIGLNPGRSTRSGPCMAWGRSVRRLPSGRCGHRGA